jgi:methyltransferase (TIGR00027 family)
MARTEGDTWDLASSVGATATMVAAQRAASHREKLIDDPFAEPLVRAVGVDFFTKVLDGEISFADVEPSFTLRRAAESMAVRTRWFDQMFLDAAASGVRQAVILAAGLDARGFRLPWPDGTTVFEVDQPEVIAFKKTTIAELGAKPTANHVTVGIDLREDWPKALRDNGFDPTQPTAWSAEGLLIYLPSEAQDRLFDEITALSAPGSRLATERVADVAAFTDNERTRKFSERLRQLGSDIQMGDLVYTGERSHVVDYLAAKGWDVTDVPARDAHAANGFEFPDGELGAEFGDLSYISAALG